ncbi:MAG: periplasmic cell division protein (SufI) [Rhodanobacteraceae bacterium]
MNRSRRRWINALAGLITAAGLTGRAQSQSAHAHPKAPRRIDLSPPAAPGPRALRLPGQSGLLADVDLSAPLELTASIGWEALLPGPTSDVWQYAGVTPEGRPVGNPTLRVRRNATLDVTLHNRIGDDTTIHWHGLMVDERNDGSGLRPVRHGQSQRYRFSVHNRGGLYWYHAHPHGGTGEQVHHGLAGLLIVEDADELLLRDTLDLRAGVTDFPLLLADKQFGLRNAIKYELGEDDWIGNKVLVNWTADARLDVPRRLCRLRLCNASNARVYKLVLRAGRRVLPYWLTGTDGGLLERPLQADQAYLAPAQRLDILVDFSTVRPGTEVLLLGADYDPMENDGGAAAADPLLEHPGAPPMGAEQVLLRLRVSAGEARVARLPPRLSKLPDVDFTAASRRPMKLWINDAGRWLINDWNFHLDHHASGFEVRRGSREIWELTNAIRSMPHPFHVHAFQFRVLRRRNSPPQIRRLALDRSGRTPQDLGLLDTVLIWPGETVCIGLDFSQPFAGRQTYMFHCHNLEHEDQGMMVSFDVVD